MSYRQMLERELTALRRRRVNLRRQIDLMSRGALTAGDATDTVRVLREAQLSLRGTEPRWGELHLLLGKEPPGTPVRLASAARTSAATKRRVGGYMTRDLAIEARRV